MLYIADYQFLDAVVTFFFLHVFLYFHLANLPVTPLVTPLLYLWGSHGCYINAKA